MLEISLCSALRFGKSPSSPEKPTDRWTAPYQCLAQTPSLLCPPFGQESISGVNFTPTSLHKHSKAERGFLRISKLSIIIGF